jgi:anti-anti-sigma factor
MDLNQQMSGAVTILEPHGRIDSATAREFGDCLSKLLNTGHNQLLIDLRSINYISSAGFRQLLIAKRSTQDKNGKLAICGALGEVRRLFDIGAFGELLPIHQTREAGIASMHDSV